PYTTLFRSHDHGCHRQEPARARRAGAVRGIGRQRPRQSAGRFVGYEDFPQDRILAGVENEKQDAADAPKINFMFCSSAISFLIPRGSAFALLRLGGPRNLAPRTLGSSG